MRCKYWTALVLVDTGLGGTPFPPACGDLVAAFFCAIVAWNTLGCASDLEAVFCELCWDFSATRSFACDSCIELFAGEMEIELIVQLTRFAFGKPLLDHESN